MSLLDFYPRANNQILNIYQNRFNPTGMLCDFIGCYYSLQSYSWIPSQGIDVGFL